TTSPAEVPGTVTPQRMPAPNGLNTVASTGSTSDGTGNTNASGARYTCDAYPPHKPGGVSAEMNPYMFAMPWREQRRYSPASHAGHDPQDWKTSSAIRSPTPTPHRAAARDPTASTTPTVSWPGTNP